ncbi:hypothetical protein DH2020_015243 [Rehmannia glutinosa]|uniref:mannan endo-1,4-beta-mannosidase n=1 Tax=Rehmannia glutinosa TaxID=99300 RepID=A0ABR0WTN0_REHGL
MGRNNLGICFVLAALLISYSKADFVKTSGTKFVNNNKPFYFNGFNAYWLMVIASEPSNRNKVTDALFQASRYKMNVARTWAFSDGDINGALQTSPGKYNEQVFEGLDFVVAEAKKRGIYLILSLVNNYNDFGGKKQYVQWARDQGRNLANDDAFFTDPVVKGFYKNHIKTVLTRVNTITRIAYKDDPTILAWELMNEPRCESTSHGKSCPNQTIWSKLNSQAMDRSTHKRLGRSWRNHFLSLNSASLQNWQITVGARDGYFSDIFNNVIVCARRGGPCGGTIFWQLMTQGMENFADGYEVILQQSPSTARVINRQSRRISSLNNGRNEEDIILTMQNNGGFGGEVLEVIVVRWEEVRSD